MNATEFFSGPVAEAVGWALLHLVWQGVLVAAILAAALALLSRRSANARYLASCIALASLLVLGIATAWREYEPDSVAMISTGKSVDVTVHQAAPLGEITWLGWIQIHLPNIVLLWMIGVALLSARLLFSWVRAQRLARRGAEPPIEWTRTVARIADAMQLRRAVKLLESAAVEVPAVVGWLRPVILVPASALTGLSHEQLEMVLAHELAHIRRNDFLVNLLQAIVETLMFYHPAVWWMSRRVRIERENCCDDLAVAVTGNALQYARALTRLEELRATTPAAAVASNGGSLLDRIRRIAAPRDAAGVSSRWAAALATVTFVTLLFVAPSLPAKSDEPAPPTPPPAPAAPAPVIIEDLPVVPGATAPTPPPTPRAPRVPRGTPTVNVAPAVAAAPTPRPMAVVAPRPAPMPEIPLTPIPPMTPMAMVDFEAMPLFDEPADKPDSEKLSIDELVQLRVMGVTPEYVSDIRKVFPAATIRQMVSLRAVGVTPEYLRDMLAAGAPIKTARDATTLRSLGVQPEFVKSLADAGYANLSVKDLTRLAAAGVNADYIRDLAKIRTKK
ncbi:MAG TPA: M56 family metallopeptidase [Thermoanaerobaculia bacterium]|nr:M56 family metallopeptidase [Thermoanaerobaculia bacterium]